MTDFHKVKEPEDIQRLCAMAEGIWREHFTPIIGAEQVEYMLEKFQSPRAVEEQLAEGYEYYIIEADGECAGYTGVHAQSGALFLSKLYVKREYRKRGLARAALDMLAEKCRREGLEYIWLTCNRNNSGSLAAYDKMGFWLWREQKTDIGGGFAMDDYVLRLDTDTQR